MLVALAIVAVLAALALAAFGKVQESAKDAKCIANLRATGAALLNQAADNNGRVVTAWGGAASDLTDYPSLAGDAQFGRTWFAHLIALGYLDGSKTLTCPSVSPYNYRSDPGYSTQTYGLRRSADPKLKFGPSALLHGVERPSSYVLLADTILWNGVAQPAQFTYQFYFMVNSGDRVHRIHARHRGKANIFFLEGSVRSLSKQDILDLKDGWVENAVDDSAYH